MAAVDISDSRIKPVRVRRYTRHAIMLTSVKYGSIARYRSGPGTPGANVSTATATPAMSVVLASKKYHSKFRQGGTDSVLFRV